jgi:hypothetical protein
VDSSFRISGYPVSPCKPSGCGYNILTRTMPGLSYRSRPHPRSSPSSTPQLIWCWGRPSNQVLDRALVGQTGHQRHRTNSDRVCRSPGSA